MRVPFRLRLKWIRFKSWLRENGAALRRRTGSSRRLILTSLISSVGLLALSACSTFGFSIDIEEVSLGDESTQVPPLSDSLQAGSPEPEITVVVTAVSDTASEVPELVWASFANGLDESGNVLTVRPNQVGFEPSPVNFALYWDYSGATGRLAYASEFWRAARGSNRSVSDLWVYEYDTGEATQWLPDNVARASWSPLFPGRFSEQRLAAAIYNTEEGRYDLALVSGPGQVEWLASCASPTFSWSPDGTQLAYAAFSIGEPGDIPQECEGVYLVSLEDGSITQISGLLSLSGSWIGDQPIWAEGQNVLLFSEASPESVFWVIPLDGSGAFQLDSEPTAQNVGQEYLPRPMYSLWSAEHRSLIGQTEGMLDPFGVWVYTFSEDMRTIEEAYRIDWGEYSHDLILVGWWDAGDSVLLRDISNTSDLNPFGVAMVWALGDQYAFELSFSRPTIEVPLYPQEVRTGVAEVDRVIEYFLVRKYEWRRELVRTLVAACTTEEFVVGPPPCQAGQAAGTRVEVFPYRQYRAMKYVTPEELDAFLEFPLGGLFAVYRGPEGGFEEEWAPAGEYSVVFVSAEGELGVEVAIDGGQVVRIEFWPLTPVEMLDGAEVDYLLPPLGQ